MKQIELFDDLRDFKLLKKYREGVFKSKAEIIEECHAKGQTNIYHVLSFGAGTQSTHLLEDHIQAYIQGQKNARGEGGIYSGIYFSDTGAEPLFIHEQVAWWKNRMKEKGCSTPFITVRDHLMEDGIEEMLMTYIHGDNDRLLIVLHWSKKDPNTGEEKKAGKNRRLCTQVFKIKPVQRAVRQMIYRDYGLEFNKKKFPKDAAVITDIGFSYDEINRVNQYVTPDHKYMFLAYPLIEQNLTTQDSIQFLKDNNMPDKRSRCYLCPFNCKDVGFSWMEIIKTEPLSFLKACYFDRELRKVIATGKKRMKHIPYFSEERIPLQELYPDYFSFYSVMYKDELEAWVEKWRAYAKEKVKENVS